MGTEKSSYMSACGRSKEQTKNRKQGIALSHSLIWIIIYGGGGRWWCHCQNREKHTHLKIFPIWKKQSFWDRTRLYMTLCVCVWVCRHSQGTGHVFHKNMKSLRTVNFFYLLHLTVKMCWYPKIYKLHLSTISLKTLSTFIEFWLLKSN